MEDLNQRISQGFLVSIRINNNNGTLYERDFFAYYGHCPEFDYGRTRSLSRYPVIDRKKMDFHYD